MKQPFLALLLLVISFVSGYELRRASHSSEQADFATYRKNQKQESMTGVAAVTEGNAAGTAPGLSGRIRSQERLVADLTKKLQEGAAALSELDQKANGTGQSTDQGIDAATVDDQLIQAQSRMQLLKDQKQAQLEQLQQQAATEQAQAQGLRVVQEQASQQLKEQLQQEKTSSAELTRKVQELTSINEDLTVLGDLRPQAQARQDRVRQLQTQYQDFQVNFAQQNALDQAQRQQRQRSLLEQTQSSFDEQIQQEQQRLSSLQKESQTVHRKQAAGQAVEEDLGDKFRSARNVQDELAHQFEVEKGVLENFKKNRAQR